MSNVNETVKEAYQVGAIQKFRKEKWAYDRAKEHGAVERYEQGLERMAIARESRVIEIPGKVVAVESTTIQAGTGQIMVTRHVGPVLESKTPRILALSPEAKPSVKSVGTPYRAIRCAIEGNAADIHCTSGTFERQAQRRLSGIAKADNLADALIKLDEALMNYARMAKRGNSKSRETFRALCYRLQHFDCPRAALEEINLGERDAKPLPKGAVRCQTFVKDSKSYLERV